MVDAIEWFLSDKIRLFLSVLGIIISISSVTLVKIIGNDAALAIKSSVAGDSARKMIVSVVPTKGNFMATYDILGNCIVPEDAYITEGLIEKFEQGFESIDRVFEYEIGQARCKEAEDIDVSVVGCTQAYIDEYGLEISLGSSIADCDKPLALVSQKFYEKIHDNCEVGDRIQLQISDDIISVIICGIYTYDEDGYGEIYLPFEYIKSIDSTVRCDSDEIVYRLGNVSDVEGCRTYVLGFFNDNYSSDNWCVDVWFDVDDLDQINDVLQLVLSIVNIIGYISFAIGGMCVFSMMMISLDERKNEIGIKRMLGLTAKSLYLSIIIETIVLVVVGTLFGAALGCSLGGVATLILSNLYEGVFSLAGFMIPTETILFTGAVSLAVCIFTAVFGIKRAVSYEIIDIIRQR